MKTQPEDIILEINRKFKSDAENALELIKHYRSKYEYMDSDRVARCVIHLSDDSLKSLKHHLELGKIDPRDVMLWAEYENTNDLNPKRIRNFNKPFKEEKL